MGPPASPPSWLHHIEDDTCDDIGDDNLGTWWEADLRQSSDNDEPYDVVSTDCHRRCDDVGHQRSPGNGAQAPAQQRSSAPH